MNSSQQLRELKGKRLLGYTIGNFGISLVNVFTGTYLFQFYVYTINLDSVLASIGISFNVFISAFFSIIFGVIMDNKKPGKLGKRRPFLLYGLPFWIISSIIVWLPPWYCPVDNPLYIPTAIYFWVVTIIGAISRSLIFNTYLAMLPEQSQTLENRHSVASLRAFFMIVASFVSLLMPLIVQSLLPNPEQVRWDQESGKIILFYIPLIGIIFSSFGLIVVLILFFSVDESFHLTYSNFIKKKVTLRDTFKRMAVPAKDYNYRNLVFVSFFIGICGSTLGLLVFPVQANLLKLTESEFLIYPAISIFGKLIWYFIWKMIIKKKSLISSYSLSLIFAAVVSFSDLLFLFSNLPYLLKMTLYIVSFATILGTNYSIPLFGIPLTATLIEEAAIRKNTSNVDETISNISGSYNGFSMFISSLGMGLSSIIIGIILTGENKTNPIIITFLFASQGVFYIIAVLFLRKVKTEKLAKIDETILIKK